MRVIVVGFLALFATIGHAALFSSEPPVREWPEFRNDQLSNAYTELTVPIQTTTTSTTTLPAPTTTIPDGKAAGPTVDREGEVDVPPPPPPVWHPEDECSRVSRPVSAQAMRWCGAVARYLHATGDWQPGDLTKLMRIIDCESRGREWVVNQSSRASGLFQHLPRYWNDRGARAMRWYMRGFDNPTILAGYDNIIVGVWLYKFGGGARHWPTCGRR